MSQRSTSGVMVQTTPKPRLCNSGRPLQGANLAASMAIDYDASAKIGTKYRDDLPLRLVPALHRRQHEAVRQRTGSWGRRCRKCPKVESTILVVRSCCWLWFEARCKRLPSRSQARGNLHWLNLSARNEEQGICPSMPWIRQTERWSIDLSCRWKKIGRH